MTRAPRSIGVVLAGGQSERMGVDKAGVVVDGETLASRAARRLAAVTGEVVIADRGRRAVAEFRSIEDATARGPAAGLLGAAAAFPGRSLLVLACDLPGVPTALLDVLEALEPDRDLVIPERANGQVEPLCARWGPRALARLASRVETGRMALHPIAGLRDLDVRRVGTAEWTRFGAAETLFSNLNTASDLKRWQGSKTESGRAPK